MKKQWLWIIIFSTSCQFRIPSIITSTKHFVPLNKEGSIFVNKYEVTNWEYQRFLNYLKETDIVQWKASLYDSVNWVQKTKWVDSSMMRVYHWHPAFDDYPVVNIDQESAQLYCEWLSEQYQLSKMPKKKKIIFRLPTKKEYHELLNTVNIPYSIQDSSERVKSLFNLNAANEFGVQDRALYTQSVNEKVQNSQKVCAIIGNVSELVENGEALGGNWASDLASIRRNPLYATPDPRIGFRVVMEVVALGSSN